VERNALRARLVERAELWRWFVVALAAKPEPIPTLLSPWPISRLPGCVDRVNQPHSPQELDTVRHSVQRGSLLGDAAWVDSIARKLNLESTLRPRGRPKSPPDAPKKEA
jgi:putative transposase